MDKVGAEVWLARREEFIIRVKDMRSRWTFRVSRRVLDALDGTTGNSPQVLFDLHRPKIYAALQELIATGGAQVQQTITEKEIRRVLAKSGESANR